jgi:hypothetical protein
VISGGKDQIWPFKVIILGIERRWGIGGKWALLVHGSIVADLSKSGEAMPGEDRIDA